MDKEAKKGFLFFGIIIFVILTAIVFWYISIPALIIWLYVRHNKKKKQKYKYIPEKKHYKPLVTEKEIIEIAQKCKSIEAKIIICELCGTTNQAEKSVPFSMTKQKCKNCESIIEVI